MDSIKTGNAVVQVLFRDILWRKNSYKKLLDPEFAVVAIFLLPWELNAVLSVMIQSLHVQRWLMLWSASAPLLPAPKSPPSAEMWIILPPAPENPQLIPYAEKQPGSLTAPQLLAPKLPSPAFIPLVQSATSLKLLPLGHQHALASSPSIPSPASFLSVQVKLNKRVRVCRIQSTDWWRWQGKAFKSTSNPIKKKLEVLFSTDTENYCCFRGVESIR